MTTTLTTTSRIFNIGSNSVLQYNNGTMKSDVNIRFPNLSFHDRNIKETFLSITHAEIPCSWYLINSTNNVLVINASTYNIPFGNYNATTLQTQLNSFLLGLGITLTYNLVTGKYTFTSATSFTIQITSTCQKFIGMGTTALSGTSITMPFPANFLPISRLVFRSTSFGTQNYNSADKSTDMFLSVQNSSSSGALILWNNYSALKYDVTGLDSLNIVDIIVTDDFGNPIDFNNADWYITIRIEYTYETIATQQLNFNKAIMFGSKTTM